jgi:hypothetical protein
LEEHVTYLGALPSFSPWRLVLLVFLIILVVLIVPLFLVNFLWITLNFFARFMF